MIDWLEKWYNSKCNGEWEHQHVLKIESLDNPGWNVEIDFNGTGIKVENVQWKLHEISENDWIGYSVMNNVFSSSGDPLKLNLMLEIFRKIINNEEFDNDFF